MDRKRIRITVEPDRCPIFSGRIVIFDGRGDASARVLRDEVVAPADLRPRRGPFDQPQSGAPYFAFRNRNHDPVPIIPERVFRRW